ncbi:hypothetical protein SELMODRAFT_103710 [Selaginella moellendorffii]|uniref:ATP-dependent RNA helicase n=1 Tax=Selaginella moellendorffii TaxID=88036 RepID=D8RX03_SELML|nr:hypothetical protein SELMODRAFT_103710 [Selaginella moellendorffii]
MKKRRKSGPGNSSDFLEKWIRAEALAPGSNPMAIKLPRQVLVNPATGFKPYAGASRFDQLPLSGKTLKGLKEAKYESMTEIQRAALPHALAGRDVLGAAKTGSGKTLAFLIPLVEKLYRLRWRSGHGLAGLVISPTRELAEQIFRELGKVAKHHRFLTRGLLIGGSHDVGLESNRVGELCILVATPGRLLHHLHQTATLDCTYLQVLVLDEADRILDSGFARELTDILAALPKQRQTLLFSATQTRSVSDLARLSLRDPEYLAVHSESAVATPATLQQKVVIVKLHRKIETLWRFIKTRLSSKLLVFLSTCTQVKFVYGAFKHLRAGVPLSCLHGRQKQGKRDLVFSNFNQARPSVLFATDIAARGLDFPAVDWVVQVDCPEDVETYIHRVGRTARNKLKGKSLLLLDPSEVKMIELLRQHKIPIEEAAEAAPRGESCDLSQQIGAWLSKDPGLKHSAQRAFVTYVRSVVLQRNKEVFNVGKLPLPEFAFSLGLAIAPRIRFLGKQAASVKNESQSLKNELAKSSSSSSKVAGEVKSCAADEDGDLFMRLKKRGRDFLFGVLEDGSLFSSCRHKKTKRLKIDARSGTGQRMVFDEHGSSQDERGGKELWSSNARIAERYKRLQQEMKERDRQDKVLERLRLRDKRLKRKAKEQKLDLIDEDMSEQGDDKPELLDSLSLADQEALALKLLSRSNH